VAALGVKQVTEIKVALPDNVYQHLNNDYPLTKKSSTIGDRAVEIIKHYFSSQHQDCNFRVLRDGADLEITLADGTVLEQIEIKGTADAKMSWSKLKVSGEQSYNKLVKDLPLYRVIDVYTQNPKIFVMRYSEDFDLVPEPRWQIRQKRNIT
jgi:hypothetical protein